MTIAKLLYIYTIGVGFIILGLCLRFETCFKYIAAISYSSGWIIISIILSYDSNEVDWQPPMVHQIHSKGMTLKHSIFSCIMISLIWIVIEIRHNSSNPEINIYLNSNLPLIPFTILFTYLAHILIMKYFDKIMIVLTTSFILLISEYVVLPLQRHHDIKDGIGLPLFFLGMLILFNTTQAPKGRLATWSDGTTPSAEHPLGARRPTSPKLGTQRVIESSSSQQDTMSFVHH
jgi:hypothetical protein